MGKRNYETRENNETRENRWDGWFVWRCLVLLICFCPLTVYGQKVRPSPAPQSLIKIPVWVESQPEQFWTIGDRRSFKLFLGEQELALKSFAGPHSSTIVLLVFDVVADLARVDEARAAIIEKIEKLEPSSWIGLIRTQDGVSVLQEPTGDREAVIEKLKSIQVSGKAGLLESLQPISKLATEMLRRAGIRLCVFYISDSGIGNYRADYLNPVINSSDSGDLSRRFSDRAIQDQMSRQSTALAEYNVPIFVLQLLQREDLMNVAYQSGLVRIATDSGGGAVVCRTIDEIRPGLDRLMAQIDSTYFLGFDAPKGKPKAARFRIEVKDAEGASLSRIGFPAQIQFKDAKR
jgi:hypothetical protein